jgi:hypothetical protein
MKWRIKDLVDKAFEISYETSGSAIHRGAKVIFADQDANVKRGKVSSIRIKPLQIPKHHLSFMSAYARHPLGNVISLVDEKPQKLDKNRTVKQAIFLAWEDGVVEKDDVIGVVDFMLVKPEKA